MFLLLHRRFVLLLGLRRDLRVLFRMSRLLLLNGVRLSGLLGVMDTEGGFRRFCYLHRLGPAAFPRAAGYPKLRNYPPEIIFMSLKESFIDLPVPLPWSENKIF
ncbi:hypothetical protein B0O99DRAFT_348547 [Bisporella sp. PMI_857]|nr:hypothetical protein B0O99DRAFT_348547 [Bisporella sp. PMI_857]